MLAIERDILEPRLRLHHATLTDLLARAARSTSSRATREAIEAVVRFAHEDRQRMLADLYAPPIDTPASNPSRRQQDGAVNGWW